MRRTLSHTRLAGLPGRTCATTVAGLPGRTCATTLVVLFVAVAAPMTARGDGLPVPGVDAGRTGVPSETQRIVTLPAREATVVARIDREGGQVRRSTVLAGRFTIPAVALDGSPGGLSADRRTLVLIRPRTQFPQAWTRFAVLDARRLRAREVVTLRGDFSFDALSPDGRTLYLIEYLSRRDPTRYAVRAYDLRGGRFEPGAVIDKSEPDERMRGLPITRETSRDGRWEYTLYDGAGSYPFIHALDTVDRQTVCIDLDDLKGHQRLYSVRMGIAGGELLVRDPTGPLATVDLETFAVREPTAAASGEPRPDDVRETTTAGSRGSRRDDTTRMPTWVAAAIVSGLVAAGAAVIAVGRRRRPAPEDLAHLDWDDQAADPPAMLRQHDVSAHPPRVPR